MSRRVLSFGNFCKSAKLLGIVFLALLVVIPCFAQAPSPAAQVLTLDQAVDYALAHYPAVRAAMSQIVAAQGGVSVANTAYLPQANLLWQVNRATRNNIFGALLPQSVIPAISGPVLPSASGANVWGDAAGLLLSWEPFDFGLRQASVNAARARETTASAQADVTRLGAAFATADACFSLFAAEQITQAAAADVQRREVFVQSVQVLVQNQLRPGADAARANADLAQARIRLIRAQTVENMSRATVANLLGLATTAIQVTPGALLGAPPDTALPSGSPVSSPLALVQKGRVDEANARDQALAKSYFPKLTLQSAISGRGSGAETNGDTLGATGLGMQRMNWIAGVQVTFPISQVFAIRAQRRVEQANEATEMARYDQALQDVSGQIAQAQINLEGARQTAQTTPIEVASARESEQQVRARYDAGLATLVEVSETQSLLVQAEMDDAVARLGVWRNLAGVAAAQGDLQPFLNLLRNARP